MTDRDLRKPLLLRPLQHDDSLQAAGRGNSARQTAVLKTLGLPGDIDAALLTLLLQQLHRKSEPERRRLIGASGIARQAGTTGLSETSLGAILLRLSAPHIVKTVLREIGDEPLA